MKTAEKRKYKGATLESTSERRCRQQLFSEIEDLAKALGKSRAGVVRLLLNRGLAEYHRDERMSARPTTPLAEPRNGYFANGEKIETISVGDSASKDEVLSERTLRI